MDPQNSHEKKLWTQEKPTLKSFGRAKTRWDISTMAQDSQNLEHLIVTVETVNKVVCLPFHERFIKQEKEAGTNFTLLSQLRNIMGGFIKMYLHRPIKILQFHIPTRIGKCLT